MSRSVGMIVDRPGVTRIAPNSSKAMDANDYNESGIRRAARGDWKGAVLDFTAAIRTDPEDAAAWCNRAGAILGMGLRADIEQAAENCRRAIGIEPRFARAHKNLGIVCVRLRRHDEAIGHFDRAIKFDPKDAEAYCNRGMARGESGDHDGAIADFDAALVLDPDNRLAYHNRGTAKAEKGDVEGAELDFARAKQTD